MTCATRWHLTALVPFLLGLAGRSSCAGLVYDASNDYTAGFNASTNPNGVWSYGWTPSLTGSLTLYADTGLLPYDNSFQTWYDPTSGLHSPFLFKNSGGVYTDTNISIPAGALIVHGGSVTGTTDFSDVIFTAPNAGMYALSTTFTGRQIGGELASVNVLDNGASLFSSSVVYSQTQSYDTTLSLAAGETIAFAVGYVNTVPVDGDSVQLQATFTAVPEPASVVPWVGGLLCLGAFRRRRTLRS